MSSLIPKFSFEVVIAILAFLIYGAILLFLKIRKEKKEKAIDHKRLFTVAFAIAVIILIVFCVIIFIVNN